MNFDLISFALGNVTGIIIASMIARAKFASLQNTIRHLNDEFREDVNDLYGRYVKERSLNEGLQASLHDVAVTKAKRIG